MRPLSRRLNHEERKLLAFVETAGPRDSYAYGHSSQRATFSVMELARYLYTSGLVLLVHRREDTGFSYVAIRTSKSCDAATGFSDLLAYQ